MFRRKILPLSSGLKNKQKKLSARRLLGSTELCFLLDEKAEGPGRVPLFSSLKNKILPEYYDGEFPVFDVCFMYITFRELDLFPSLGVREKISY
jgi:hypothetical protein